MRAISWLFYILGAFILVVVLGTAAAGWLVLQNQPATEASSTARNDGSKPIDLMQLGRITPESTLLLELSQSQVNQLVEQQIAQTDFAGSARTNIQINPGTARVDISAALPISIDRRYLNVVGQFSIGAVPADIKLTELQVGTLRIPGWLRSLLVPYAMSTCRADHDCNTMLAAYKNVAQLELNQDELRLQYALAATGSNGDAEQDLASEAQRLAPYLQELANMAAERQGQRLNLHTALKRAFSLAQRQSVLSNDAIAENRSALLALATMGADPRVLDLLNLGAMREQITPLDSLYLRGRKDLAQHFLTSAALYLLVGGELSEYLGIYKELEDVGKGKPFGVGDLVADRVGIRIAQQATESRPSALRLQSQLITSSSVDAYLLTETVIADLQQRYQTVNDFNVPDLTEQIDRLLAELPLLTY